jgi:hypothetical protein
MRVPTLGILASLSLCFAALPANAESSTTRIEPRPFYGATVTLEEGVRVFRPLPPHNRVIINPGNKTPVSLGFEERQIYSYSQNHNYNYDANAGHPDAISGAYVPNGRHHGSRHGHHHHGRAGGVR